MIKVQGQIDLADKYTIITLDTPIPLIRYSKICIDGTEYKTGIVYDLPNSIGIPITKKDLRGREVTFKP